MVTIKDIQQYEATKAEADKLGMRLECDASLQAFTLNPKGANGLVIHKDIRDMEIYLSGYRAGINT